MKPTLLLGSVLVAMLVSANVNTCTSEDHNQWIAEVQEQIRGIHTGMTRADLERLFRQDGGMTFPPHDRYIYRDCTSIKIDVDFEMASGNVLQTGPGDRITKLSKPYLELMFTD
jgi:hypothetical protein